MDSNRRKRPRMGPRTIPPIAQRDKCAPSLGMGPLQRRSRLSETAHRGGFHGVGGAGVFLQPFAVQTHHPRGGRVVRTGQRLTMVVAAPAIWNARLRPNNPSRGARSPTPVSSAERPPGPGPTEATAPPRRRSGRHRQRHLFRSYSLTEQHQRPHQCRAWRRRDIGFPAPRPHVPRVPAGAPHPAPMTTPCVARCSTRARAAGSGDSARRHRGRQDRGRLNLRSRTLPQAGNGAHLGDRTWQPREIGDAATGLTFSSSRRIGRSTPPTASSPPRRPRDRARRRSPSDVR